MKIEVHKLGGLRTILDIDPSATNGATIGRNVWNADGTLFSPASGSGAPVSVSDWSLVLNVPPNVQALADIGTTGLYVVTGPGTSVTRSIGGVSGQIDVTNGDGVSGAPQIGLADVPNGGDGAFLLFYRDAKGRVVSTTPGTSDDVTEGLLNLYFTAARVRATTLTGLDTSLTGPVAATDTVLQAFGKLAGQQYTYDDLKASLVAGANITLTPDDIAQTITITGTGGGGGGGVSTVTGGTGIAVDNTDPDNPVVALSSGSITSLARADSALQPSAIGTTVQPYDADLTAWAAIAPSAKANSGSVGSSALTMATARLLGRTTAGTGAVEELQVGTGLSLGTAGMLSLSANLQSWSGIAPSSKADASALANYLPLAAGAGSPLTGPLVIGTSSTNSTYVSLGNTAPGGRSYTIFSSGGGPAPAGSYGIYDNTAGALRFVMDASGNVALGASTPVAKVDIRTATNNGIRVSDGTYTGVMFASGLGGLAFGTTSNHPVYFLANNANVGRITQSGQLFAVGGMYPGDGTVSLVGSAGQLTCSGQMVVSGSFLGLGAAANEFYRANNNSTSIVRQPRWFIGGADPGAAAAEGDCYVP